MLSYLLDSIPNFSQRTNLNSPILPASNRLRIEKQNLRHGDRAGFLVDEFSPAINNADLVRLLNFAKALRQRRTIKRIHAGIKNLAVGARARFTALVAGPEWSDQNVPRTTLEIDVAGQKPLQNGADAANFLNRFVGDVNDGLHRKRPLQIETKEAQIRENYTPDFRFGAGRYPHPTRQIIGRRGGYTECILREKVFQRGQQEIIGREGIPRQSGFRCPKDEPYPYSPSPLYARERAGERAPQYRPTTKMHPLPAPSP